MNTRCYRCGWSFSLSREAISGALDVAHASGAKSHMERCPRCRQAIKISVDQLKRAAPGWKPPTALSPNTEPTPAAPEATTPAEEPVEAESAPAPPKRKSAAKKKSAA